MWEWFKNRVWTICIRFGWTGYKQVKITITRLDTTDRGVFGHLVTDNGFDCVTLENHILSVPEGTYKVTLYASPDHGGMIVPLLHNVPGRSFIEIHPGNWEKDSKGCILVGQCRDGMAVDKSVDTFKALMAKLQDCDDIEITIK